VVGAFVRLTVRDNGCGMDKEVLENLFEPFFTTKEPGKGTGLGLATVYGIMRQNKGFIDVVSEPGAGSSFHLYLPCHRDRPGSGTDGGVRRTLVFNHETILVVEDELANLKLTAVMLRRLGLEVLTAETPADAIELAKTHTRVIQLLITDVIMPEMNGQELARILTGICPGLKCLFMSGYTSEVIGRHGLMDEAVHFLQKPFTLSDLQEKVSQAMGSKE
jgi:CheY-like chemotaxis protein